MSEFTRSEYTDDSSSQLTVIMSAQAVSYRSSAVNQPNGLETRLSKKENPLEIWVQSEEYHRYFKDDNPISSLSSENDILRFCRDIAVHPAHLVPLKSSPSYFLPQNILKLLLRMVRESQYFHADDVELAKIGILFEQKRINLAFYQITRHNQGTDSEGRKQLCEIFSNVLNAAQSKVKLSSFFDVYSTISSKPYRPIQAVIELCKLSFSKDHMGIEEKRIGLRENYEHQLAKVFKTYQALNAICSIPKRDKQYLLNLLIDMRDYFFRQNKDPAAMTLIELKTAFTESQDDIVDIYDFSKVLDKKAYPVALQNFFVSIHQLFDTGHRIEKAFIKDDASKVEYQGRVRDFNYLIESTGFLRGELQQVIENMALIRMGSQNRDLRQLVLQP